MGSTGSAAVEQWWAWGPDTGNIWRIQPGVGFAGSTGFFIDSSGKVGIGTTSPDNLLTVNGSADKPGGGSWGTFSDGRLKTVEGTFQAGLEEVLQLHPIRYRYKQQNALGIKDHDEHVGFVAQDVEKVVPEAVSQNAQGYRIVNNDPILWTMLNAIQQQQAEISALRGQVEQLKEEQTEIRQLRADLERLKASEKARPAALAAAVR
jgi:hypothetical protein